MAAERLPQTGRRSARQNLFHSVVEKDLHQARLRDGQLMLKRASAVPKLFSQLLDLPSGRFLVHLLRCAQLPLIAELGMPSGMKSLSGRILIRVVAGCAIVAASFWSTLLILNYWSTPEDPNANRIHVTEATYGNSCKDFVPPGGHANLVKPGNATAAVSGDCENKKASCTFTVDAAQLGDPAPGCGKDFTVSWRCGADQAAHQAYLSAEANNRSAFVSCD